MTTTTKQATCGARCWQAKEPDCACICNGRSHGILNQGGEQPQRIRQKHGMVYTLDGVYDNWSDAFGAQLEHRREYGYNTAFEQRATDSQRKWPEVQSVSGTNWREDRWLLWTRRDGANT